MPNEEEKTFSIDLELNIKKNRGAGMDNNFCKMTCNYPLLNVEEMTLVEKTVIGGLLALGDSTEVRRG